MRFGRGGAGRGGAIWLVLCLALAAVLPAPPAAAQDAPLISRVEAILVEGARRVDDATVQAYMTVRPGEPATAAEINLSVRRLLDTGLFEDVTISPLGNALLVQVREAPFINRVAFEGNDQLSDDTLRAAVLSASRAAFSRAVAERDARTILELYRRSGRFGATVEPKIIEREGDRVDLVFEIFEGRITGIRSINFVGNRVFSDRRLRDAVETRETGILGFLFGSATYDPDRLELDKELLRRFYLDRGYADFRVLAAAAELTADREDFIITFTVEEGEVYRFGSLELDIRLPELDPEALMSVFAMREGDVYSAKLVDDSIERLIFEIGQAGFAFIDVRPRARKDDDARTIDVILEVAEGPRVYIERIEIEGNTRTVDRVLRRQFRVAEGDAFNAREIEAARGRLRALGFFDQVAVNVERGSADDRAVVRVGVVERLTGALSIGIGFSSADGVIGDLSVTERNFLGRGQSVAFRFNVSGDERAFDFSFTEPALLDRDLAAGFQIGYVQINRVSESSFQETNIGFRPFVEFPFAEDQRLRLRYRISSDEIRDVVRTASPAIFRDRGRAITSGPGATWTLDRRNDPVEPTHGYLVELRQDFAGVGGDAFYSRSVARAKGWRALGDERFIGSLEFEAGAAIGLGRDLRITDRFFLGGDSFRGFARDGIGPRDRSFVTLPALDRRGNVIPGEFETRRRRDALGGNYYAIARAEVSFPLGLPEEFGLYGGLFMDAGTLFGLDRTTYADPGNLPPGVVRIDDGMKFRAAAGASLFIDSPFGPLRFNFAYPLVKDAGDKTEFFRFTVGTRF